MYELSFDQISDNTKYHKTNIFKDLILHGISANYTRVIFER